jgi:hypothetical protein
MRRVLECKDCAIEYVKGVIRDLLMNKVDMSLLVVTKVAAAATLQRCVSLSTAGGAPSCMD